MDTTAARPIEPGRRRAGDIAPLEPEAAVALEGAELDRLLALLDALTPDEWAAPLPGAPHNWDVRALAAQIAGAYAAQASLAQLRRQANPRLLRFYRLPGRSLGDTVRQMQVGERIGRPPHAILAELREVGPRAVRNRAVAVRPLTALGRTAVRRGRLPAIPAGPVTALLDLWFHRFAVCAVTGRTFLVTDDHDGPIVAEQLRPAGAALARFPEAVDLVIAGLATIRTRFGAGDAPVASIAIDAVPFGLLASRRRSAAWARERATIDGDVRCAVTVLTAIWQAAAARPY